jgi:hypothetical protein
MEEERYMLEIYMPGATETVAATFESSSPFNAIAVGDLLNPAFWPTESELVGKLCRVIGVEHIFWTFQGVAKHKLCVFTEAVDKTHEVRLKGR